MKKLLMLMMVISTPALAADRIAKYDSDMDGYVSYKELTQFCDVSRKLFELADKNGDERLTNVELRQANRYLLTKCDKVD
jgi:Ca2+-binding EF-hand superfamily protein